MKRIISITCELSDKDILSHVDKLLAAGYSVTQQIEGGPAAPTTKRSVETLATDDQPPKTKKTKIGKHFHDPSGKTMTEHVMAAIRSNGGSMAKKRLIEEIGRVGYSKSGVPALLYHLRKEGQLELTSRDVSLS